jgi:hypothetical protein
MASFIDKPRGAVDYIVDDHLPYGRYNGDGDSQYGELFQTRCGTHLDHIPTTGRRKRDHGVSLDFRNEPAMLIVILLKGI